MTPSVPGSAIAQVYRRCRGGLQRRPRFGSVGAMLTLRYDPASRNGFVRLREGRAVRTRRLSEQAVAEYGRHGQLLTISISDLDASAAEFLRTADEETLLRVISEQTGRPAAAAPQRRRARAPRR